jgi:large subunit ribosomal protein L15
MPLQRRLPKRRGFSRSAMPLGMHRKEFATINVGQLERFEAGTIVDPQMLKEHRIIKKLGDGLRVLGEGKITVPLTVRASHFSESARRKIEAAGGKAEVI